jgi:predicted enzyme related to lactoylglutathione lyase
VICSANIAAMGERSSYPHGTFSWVENATSDPDGAKRFYAQLFGWEYDDNPVGDAIYYTMAKLRDHFVAAIAPQQSDEAALGVPAHWNSDITVDDVDAVSARVEELGGTVHAPAFDVIDAGRMSAISDPTGAVVYFWQAKNHIGAGLVNEPGTLCWNDLATRDPAAAERFWSELLGWRFEQVSQEPAYWTIYNGDRKNGGMRQLGDELGPDIPAHWIAYFGVESIDATAETATGAGAQVHVPRTQVTETGAFAVLTDPIGAAFALVEGTFDD